MAECTRCHANIQWAETLNGKAMPLDMTPVDFQQHGAMVVYEGVGGRTRCASFGRAVDDMAERKKISVLQSQQFIEATCEAFVSHFSTCPNAGEFRR